MARPEDEASIRGGKAKAGEDYFDNAETIAKDEAEAEEAEDTE